MEWMGGGGLAVGTAANVDVVWVGQQKSKQRPTGPWPMRKGREMCGEGHRSIKSAAALVNSEVRDDDNIGSV
jgi:hypothetical protein